MTIVRRYLRAEILHSTLLVFAALLMLFALLDIVRELKDLGTGNYRLPHIVLYVVLSVPGHFYELFPIAALIGTLFALAQLVASSEFTVMRVSGVSLTRMAFILSQIGLLFAAVNFLVGEVVAPWSEQTGQQIRLRATRGVIAQDFRSGLWVKESSSFVNVINPLPDNSLAGVKIYEFDSAYRLQKISFAETAVYLPEERHWRLKGVVQTLFEKDRTRVTRTPEATWQSVLSPDILNVLQVVPQQRSARDLYQYVQHLQESRQQSRRFEIALWTKFTNPLAIVVTMLMALPFSQFQRRTGGVGLRLFLGVMLGVVFWMVSQLFANLGSINEWPPGLSATAPSLLFLAAAVSMIAWLERR